MDFELMASMMSADYGSLEKEVQALEEGGEVGVIPQGLAPAGVAGVLPLRPVVRPADPGGVRGVLNPGVTGGNGDISVYIAVIMARYRVSHTKQVWHWRHSISVKSSIFFRGNLIF